MKLVLHMAILLALLIAPQLSQAKDPPAPGCIKALKWNRWNYTKAHINVTQALRRHNPKPVRWIDGNSSQRICKHRLRKAKALRLAEQQAWSKLRLQPEGVKWTIRKQFQSCGDKCVRDAWQIVSCESNFKPRAYNGADSGIWQINQIHNVPKYVMFNPELSTGWAWRASKHGTDFTPWVCAHRYGIA